MKYWIIVGGVTEGPFTFEQLQQRALPGRTPVWRSGLADWTYLEQLPEWQQAAECPEPAPATGATPPPLQRHEQARMQYHGSHPWRRQRGPAEGEPAPTYLGWCIAATLLCCTVLGIVAIVYALRVRDENARGYYEEARRDSRTLELWLMAAITFGLVSIPFSFLMALA